MGAASCAQALGCGLTIHSSRSRFAARLNSGVRHHMGITVRLWMAIFSTLLLAGCVTTPPPIPPELQYSPPIGAQGPLASVVGSQQNSTLLDDFTAFIISVDGKRVMTGRKGWSTPIQIAPGQRTITVAFQRGSFNAQAELPLQATAGTSYQVQFTSDVHVTGANSFCDFWVIDSSSKKAVTEIRRGVVSSSGQSMTPIFLPIH
jgi:hypothetical protein